MMGYSNKTFAEQGFSIVNGVVSPAECAVLNQQVQQYLSDLTPRLNNHNNHNNHGNHGNHSNNHHTSRREIGNRGLLNQTDCLAMADTLRQHPALNALIPADYVAVQCTYFEKTPQHNWLVPLHQDLSIPVAKRIEHLALKGWSFKDGTWFVPAPIHVLDTLIAVRLHLDVCGETDGALRVLAGSHRHGVVDADALEQLKHTATEHLCCVLQGGVLVLKPLLLHASSKSTGSSLRRVLHWVYAPPSLPLGLSWQ
jgi:ectoine hydroxylase-related dioxygenase (phytanoyl-CoA dioxygenase family)